MLRQSWKASVYCLLEHPRPKRRRAVGWWRGRVSTVPTTQQGIPDLVESMILIRSCFMRGGIFEHVCRSQYNVSPFSPPSVEQEFEGLAP